MSRQYCQAPQGRLAAVVPRGDRGKRRSNNSPRGFTLIELMVAVAIVAILASVAMPAYTAYIQRSRVPPALDGLSSYATRMEQRYQDSGSYGSPACGATLPTAANFTITCASSAAGQGFTATATGSGAMAGYAYTINHQGTRVTTAHPKGVPGASCWTTRGSTCDT